MLFYAGFEIFLFAFAVLAWKLDGDWRAVLPSRVVIWVVILFRFQTGYDWPFYEQLHNHLVYAPDEPFRRFVEPGFYAFNWLIARMTDNVMPVYWIVSAFVLLSFTLLERLFDRKFIGLFWAVVVNFLLYSVFFSVVRQSASLAFVLIGVYLLTKGRWKAALLPFILAPLFHVFGAAYVGLALLGYVVARWSVWKALAAFVGLAILGRIAWQLAPYLPPIGPIYQIALYVQRPPALDPETLFVFVLCVGVVVALNLSPRISFKSSVLASIATVTAIAMVALIDVEVIRNRLLYLLAPCSIAAAFALEPKFKVQWPAIAVAGLSALSAVYYVTWLGRQTSFMLVPYQSALFIDEDEALEVRARRLESMCGARSERDEGGDIPEKGDSESIVPGICDGIERGLPSPARPAPSPSQ